MSGKSLSGQNWVQRDIIKAVVGKLRFLTIFLIGQLCREARENHARFNNPKAFQNPSLEWLRLSQSWQRKQLPKIILKFTTKFRKKLQNTA